MSRTCGEAGGSTGESSPSVGLAVVDSMTARQIKAFASHAQGFPKPPQHRIFDRLRKGMPNRAPDLLFRWRHYAGFRWFPSIRNSLSGNRMIQRSLPPSPSSSPNPDDQRTPDPAHRGYCLVHGEHGFHGHRDVASGDRGRHRHQPADAETRHYLLFAVARGVHSGERLDRRPVRRAAGVQPRGRRLHGGVDRLRVVVLGDRIS